MRVFVADDQAIVRRGVRATVDAQPGWSLCGEARDGPSALAAATALQPDVAVIDVCLPALNGLLLTRLLREACPRTEVLLYSMRDDDETLSRALAAGARGYLLKTEPEDQLVEAIEALGKGQTYFSSVVSELLLKSALEAQPRAETRRFTDRELQIVRLVVEGASNRRIAEALGISIKTVESHRAAAMRKAGVHSLPDFVRFAIRRKLVEL